MNALLLRNIFRFGFLFSLQVFVFRNISFESFNYVSIFVYPLAIMMLPMATPTALTLLIGFFYGLLIDNYYNTIGMHAAAGVFVSFVRNWLLDSIEPSGGYKGDISPTKRQLGFNWFLTYSMCFMGLFCIWFFSVEVYTFVYWREILSKAFASFMASMVFVMIYVFVFDPID
ncbi:MAG: hypothetical protein RL757_856 [Bacteroidota bacterium]|jgi:hypothetical protein